MTAKNKKEVNKKLDYNELSEDTKALVQEGETLSKELDDFVSNLNLTWSYRSVEYLTRKERISLGQLRSCIFLVDGEPTYDTVRAIKYIIMSGMITKDNMNKLKELEDEAYEIVEKFMEEVGYFGALHIKLIKMMEEKHFFINSQDRKLMTYLAYKGNQTELGMEYLMKDAMETQNQVQALFS